MTQSNGIIFVLVVLIIGYSATGVRGRRNERDDLFYKLQQEFKKYGGNLTEFASKPAPKVGYDFFCPESVSPTIPQSVHELRPGDIKVMGAMGDSLTAAYGAGASTFTPVMFEYPGEAASIGGDQTLDHMITLPNIFRKYNPHVYGFSTGLSVLYGDPKNKKLNVAISGSIAKDMPEQTKDLITKMKSDPHVNFEKDWKFITLFIGGNDLCSGCITPGESSPEQYIKHVEKALQILHDESPRTFVNVLSVPTLDQIVKLRGPFTCNLVTSIYCPCALGGSIPEHFLKVKSREFQRLIRTSVESEKYDDRDDFTVVYQPFMEDSTIPLLPNGNIDRSFFAPDCFHLSQKGQAAQAAANWNNLLQPVGSKTNYYILNEGLDCPSVEFPYLYTNINSKPSFKPSHKRSQKNNKVLKDFIHKNRTSSRKPHP